MICWIKVIQLIFLCCLIYLFRLLWSNFILLLCNFKTSMLETCVVSVPLFVSLKRHFISFNRLVIRWTLINMVFTLWENSSWCSSHVFFNIKITIRDALSTFEINGFWIIFSIRLTSPCSNSDIFRVCMFDGILILLTFSHCTNFLRRPLHF